MQRLFSYVVHLLLEATIDLVALGQRGLELVKLLGVEGQLGGVGRRGEGGAERGKITRRMSGEHRNPWWGAPSGQASPYLIDTQD